MFWFVFKGSQKETGSVLGFPDSDLSHMSFLVRLVGNGNKSGGVRNEPKGDSLTGNHRGWFMCGSSFPAENQQVFLGLPSNIVSETVFALFLEVRQKDALQEWEDRPSTGVSFVRG